MNDKDIAKIPGLSDREALKFYASMQREEEERRNLQIGFALLFAGMAGMTRNNHMLCAFLAGFAIFTAITAIKTQLEVKRWQKAQKQLKSVISPQRTI